MKTAYAVIGSSYGDEGKGRNVDAISRSLGGRGVVVRSNGGAQAGHTVVSPDGARHVFHHLGSGAFAGASTHLSRFFVHHPMTFMDERDVLEDGGACVTVTADPRGYVTTPWDMMVNQVLELSRGGARHGSCGYGLGETMGRNEESIFGLTLAQALSAGASDILEAIRDEWLPARLQALGLEPDPETRAAISSPAVMERFLSDIEDFRAHVAIRDDASLEDDSWVVFEGAQGLLLDQKGDDFPHVTRSNTGIENMAAICREAGIGRIEASYASRCYLTRHGAGPMPDERDLSRWFQIEDRTNVPNPWQSSIRYGLLDLDRLSASIRADIEKGGGVVIDAGLAFCCLDQAVDGIPHIASGRIVHLDAQRFVRDAASSIGLPLFAQWHSPSNPVVSLAA